MVFTAVMIVMACLGVDWAQARLRLDSVVIEGKLDPPTVVADGKSSTTLTIRVTENDIRALSAVCTHLGCIVKWDGAKQQLVCPCHVAAFDVNGNVVGGPAPSPLQSLAARIVQDEIIIGDA